MRFLWFAFSKEEGASGTNGSFRDAIAAAADKVGTPDGAEEEDSEAGDDVNFEGKNKPEIIDDKTPTKEKKDVSKKDDDEDDEDEENEDAEGKDEEEIERALQLAKILKDPASRRELALKLAKEQGLLTEDLTKKEEAQVKKTVLATLEKYLGEDYKFLAPKFAQGLEEVLENFKQETFEKLDRDVKEQRLADLKEQLTQDFNTIRDEITDGLDPKVAKTLIKAANVLSDDVMRKEGQSAKDYFRRLFKLAALENNIALSTTNGKPNGKSKNINLEDRRKKNANDGMTRLSSERDNTRTAEDVPTGDKSIKDAVQAAAEKVAKKFGFK